MTTYYVANGGSDLNLGTSSILPWQTVAKVNASSFSAGDSVLFNDGDRWYETLTIPSSGSAGNVLTFSAYGSGANPIIDGSTLTNTWSWTNTSGNIWRTSGVNGGTQILQGGVRLVLAGSSALPSAGSWYTDNSTYTYVWGAGNENPNSVSTIAYSHDGGSGGHAGSCVNMNGKSYVTFDSVDATRAQNSGYNFQDVSGTDHITVQNCNTFYNGLRGVDMAHLGSTHTNATFTNLVSHDNIGECLWVGSGTGHLVQNCEGYHTVNDYANGYPTSGLGGGVLICNGINNTVQNCYMHSLYFANYYMVEYQGTLSTGTVMTGNTALMNVAQYSGIGYGFSLEGGTGTQIYGNRIIASSANTGRGMSFTYNGTNQTFANNVVYGTFVNWACGYQSSVGTGNVAKNNIVYLTAGAGFWGVSSAGVNGGSINYNDYWPAVSGTYFFEWDPDSSFPNTLASWRTHSGQDANALNSDPSFVAAGTANASNFHLALGSPCLQSGITVAGVSTGAAGLKPDMGAYQDDWNGPSYLLRYR